MFFQYVLAHQEVGDKKIEGLQLSFKSVHESSISGSSTITLTLHVNDSLQLNDSLRIKVTGNASGNDVLFNSSQLVEGDSIDISVNVSYDSSSISFIPQGFRIEVYKIENEAQLMYCNASGVIYKSFSGGIYIENNYDFILKKRRYPTGLDSSVTYKILHQVPQSDLSDSLEYDSIGEIHYRFYDSLPYAIAFKNGDTFNYDPIISSAPPLRRADGCGLGRKRFHANFTNLRIYSWYRAENNSAVRLYQANTEVEIRINRWPDQVIMKTKTDWEGYLVDENGNRNFDFSFCAGSGRNQVDIFLTFNLHDPNYKNDLRLKSSWSTDRTEEILTERQTLFYSQTAANIAGNFGEQVGGDFELSLNGALGAAEHQSHSFGIPYTFMAWSRKVCNEQLSPEGQGNLPNLTLKIGWNRLQNENAHYNGPQKVISLGIDRTADQIVGAHLNERTLYHEFGHYLMHHLYGNWNNSFGRHSWGLNNEGTGLAMSEGVANGVSAILDIMLYHVDNEVGIRRNDGFTFHDRPEFRPLNTNPVVDERNLNTPILSETFIAVCMQDLFDGPQRYESMGIPLTEDDWISSDVDQGGRLHDNVELSFVDIFKPFWQNKGNLENVEKYFNELVKLHGCENASAIREVFQWNASDIGTINVNDIPSFVVNQDLETSQTMNLTGFKVKKNDELVEKSISHDHRRAMLELSTTFNSFNYGVFGSPLSNIQNLSDNLNVVNGASLEFNSSNQVKFYNRAGGSTSQTNDDLFFSICPFTLLNVDNSSSLIIGSITPARKAFVNAKHDSRISLEGATLEINNNSKLVIEIGATLEYHPNTQIILNGPNAILEIRGNIRLMNGAEFSVQGGAQGLGKVIFHKDWQNPTLNIPRLISGNGSVALNGSGKTNTLIEVTGNEGLVVFNDITNFSIANAKVEMGIGSKLIAEASQLFSMNNVDITALNTSQKHGGVHVWGCGQNKFENTDVSYGTVGFNNYPERHNRTGGNPCRSKLILENVNITNCDVGIHSQGNDIVFKNGSITDFSNIGWRASAQSTISLLSGVNIESNAPNAQGVQRFGNGTVQIFNSQIHELEHGFYTEEGFIRPNCSEFYNNVGIGAWLEGDATLSLSNGSKSIFSNNASQHILSRYNGVLQFSGGENAFINPSSQSAPGFWASLRPNQPFTASVSGTQKSVDGSDNFMPSWSPILSSSGSGDYLFHDNVSSSSYYHEIINSNNGPNFNSSSSFFTYWNAECPTTVALPAGDWTNWGEKFNLNNKYGGSGGNDFFVITTNTNTWGTSTLGANYASLANMSDDSTADPKLLLERSIEILSIDFSGLSAPPLGLNASLQDLYSFASRAYYFAYSRYTQNADSIDSLKLDSINNSFFSLSDSLIGRAANSMLPWSNMHFKLGVNKSTVSRLSRDHDQAISDLNAALLNVQDSLEIKYINRWICVNEQEKSNRLDSNFSDSTQDVFDFCYNHICQGDYNVNNNSTIPGNISNLKENKETIINIYPNPTSGGFWIQSNDDLEGMDINMYSLDGRIVTVTLEKIGGRWHVGTPHLSSGQYIVELIRENGKVLTQRLTILN